MKKILSILILLVAISALVGCSKDKDDDTSSNINNTTWVRVTAPGESVTYVFTSSGYTKKTKYIFQGQTSEYVSDNGTYILEGGDLTLYSGMGVGIITGTISGKKLTIRGFEYTKQ